MKIPLGFPFYFKFGSANLQAQVQAFGNENKLVQIKYYGWRMTMFDEYRNAVTVKRNQWRCDTKPSDFILGILCILLVTLFLSIQFVRGWFDSEN